MASPIIVRSLPVPIVRRCYQRVWVPVSTNRFISLAFVNEYCPEHLAEHLDTLDAFDRSKTDAIVKPLCKLL